jgi:hypothetical protein
MKTMDNSKVMDDRVDKDTVDNRPVMDTEKKTNGTGSKAVWDKWVVTVAMGNNKVVMDSIRVMVNRDNTDSAVIMAARV